MIFDDLDPPYATIVADPPWHYSSKGPLAKPLPYSTMTNEEIASLPVIELVGRNAHLWLWTTNTHLPAAFQIVEAWGFEYRRCLVWAKVVQLKVGRFPPNTEFLLWCTRGSIPMLGTAESSWFTWPRQHGHSKKPGAFFDLVHSISPGPYLELFSRQPLLGWDAWGYGFETPNRVNSLDKLPSCV